MKFTLIQTPSEFDALAGDWNALLAESITDAPFLRHEYLRVWWQTRGGGEWPRAELAVVTASDDGRLTGIAPLFFTENRDGQPALMLLGSIEISDYLDVIARPGDLPAFIDGLLDFLAQPGLGLWRRAEPRSGLIEEPVGALSKPWRALDWYNIPEISPTLPVLKAEAEKRGLAFTEERVYHAPYIPLPGNFEVYLAAIDKKQRHEIRRKMRRLAEYGEPVRWYIVEDGSVLDAEVDALFRLMEQDPAKAAFLTEAMRTQIRATVHAAFRAGWLQLSFLEVGGEKAAANLNFDYDNRIWGYNSGVGHRFMELSPGWVLLGNLLQWANEHMRSEYDFMRGNEAYKYRFGAADRFVVRVKIAQ